MLPLLLLVVASVVELGFAARDALRAEAAAAAGSQAAMLTGFDPTRISAAVVGSTGAAGLTATPAPAMFCGCPLATGISVMACNNICADGINTRVYVRVSASIVRTTVIDANLGLPAVLTRQSIARLP